MCFRSLKYGKLIFLFLLTHTREQSISFSNQTHFMTFDYLDFGSGLSADDITKACRYGDNKQQQLEHKQQELREPQWRELNDAGKYRPSYNQSPGQYLPVLLLNSSLDEPEEERVGGDRIISPMRWGLVPPWHTGDCKDFSYKTINCRLEGIESNRFVSSPLTKGRRCVILAEGFFEWKKVGQQKQPHFFYLPQPNSDTEEGKSIEDQKKFDDGDWKGLSRLLTLAGVYEVNQKVVEGQTFYSFTIITVPAHHSTKWIHDRMPAILDSDEAISQWLDHENVPTKEALKLLKPFGNLQFHRVTSAVGNWRNDSVANVLPLKDEKDQKDKNQKKITDMYKVKPQLKSPKRIRSKSPSPSDQKAVKQETNNC